MAFPGNPESPLLVHPLLESAGGDFFHSGGKHFNSQNDPEWLTLKEFVMEPGPVAITLHRPVRLKAKKYPSA